MARVRESYPAPVQGVSTLSPRNRVRGQAGLQLNMRSDPIAKLTRRPSSLWNIPSMYTSLNTTHHSYYRNNNMYSLTILEDGRIYGSKGTRQFLIGSGDSYLTGTNLRMCTIKDTTFVVNTDVVVAMQQELDESYVRKVSHINVVNALNYSTTLTVSVKDSAGLGLALATVTIPDGVDNLAEADAVRATNAVAVELTTQLNLNTEGLVATTKGSSIAVRRADNSSWLTIEVDSGRSDDVVAVNQVIESVEGLPLYAYPGTRITVSPNPTTEDGNYYLEATTLEGLTLGDIQEVVWTESRSPYENHTIDSDTMPRVIVYDHVTDAFTVSEKPLWESRITGDDISVEVPAFVGTTINAVGYFQNRLVVLSENTVSMTRTDNIYDWWKKSAVNLLVTDPISVVSNSTGIDTLQHLVEHNRDLLVIASNGQFKIDGTVGVTPQTVAMPLTMTQDVQVNVPPVSLGTGVYMPISYGSSTGILHYSGARDSSDTGESITGHVVGYLEGDAELLVSSSNMNMLALTTTDSADNEIFIYEQFHKGTKKLQESWSKWTLPEVDVILDMYFLRDELIVIVNENTAIVTKTLSMYEQVDTKDIFLDNLLVRSTTGTSISIPVGYPSKATMTCVMGEGTVYPREEIPFTIGVSNGINTTINFSEDIGEGTVYVGFPFESKYTPTRPFKRDEQGNPDTSARVRIAKWVLDVVDTEDVYMNIASKYYTIEDQLQSPRILNTSQAILGEVSLHTGEYAFSYAQLADLAEATFYTNGYLGMNIAGISWEGQYTQISGGF